MLPYLSEVKNSSKKYSVLFRGINYGEGVQDGEFAETQNLSTSKYPYIMQRGSRVKVNQYTNPSTIHAKGDLLVIDGTKVFYGEKEVGTVTEGKKQTATIGNYIVIFPDKKYYIVPTESEPEGIFGDMETTNMASGVRFTSSTITGILFTTQFRAGDAVSIEGCSNNANNKTAVIRNVEDELLTFDENTFTEGVEQGMVTIKRKVPDLEFICENNYRLWGTNGNTIFASSFGDPLNFFVREGLASDGYDIQVGSEGEFTGCIPYSSHICFFKENVLHKMYGTKPSNFQINTVKIYGVQSGSERSMHIVNEQLLYKGVNGVYAYTGGVPELISEKLGNNRYSDAVACCDGEIYYISMRQGDKYHLFAFDVAKNIWLREDETHAVDMALHYGKVYFIDSNGGLYYIDKNEEDEGIEWSATFCTMHETVNERKGYSKFHLRLDLSAGAWLAVDIKTDTEPQWRQIYVTHNERAKTMSIPIIPTRCDSIDIRLRGQGKCIVKAFIREFRTGSDI